MTVNSDNKLQKFPYENDNPNIVAAMMQVILSFPAHRTLLYGQRSFISRAKCVSILLIINMLAYLWSKSRDNDSQVY